MKKLLSLLIVISFGFHLEVEAQVNSIIQGELSNLIIEENPDFYIQYRSSRELKDGFIVRFFIYKIKDDDWPGGVGFEITHPERSSPLWYKMIHGDFGPHSVRLLDVNNDGKLDLFFYAGFEDVFSTFIYTASYTDAFSDPFHKDNFVNSYTNENDYSVLIKPEGAQQPVILDSGYEGNIHVSGMACFDDQSAIVIKDENRLTISETIREEIREKYFEITGQLDEYNFNYNMPEVYFLFNTKILDPVKLYQIEGELPVEVTSEYPEYLEWRIDILKQIKNDSSENCSEIIKKRVDHLKSYINR